jgi:hypothetical protein
VLNAKGGEIKVKATGSANHLRILKIVELEFVICPKYFYCKKLVSYGFAQTSVFDLEIGKRI